MSSRRLPRFGLPLAAVAVFVTSVGVPAAFGHTVPDFEDVPEGHVAEAAIRWAAENEVTVGVGDNRFGVGDTLTRYQMVTFLCRAFDPGNCQSGVRGSDSFDDVPVGHWANYSVGWAASRGITSGVSATEFGGAQTLTREQMITFLYRAKGSPTGGSHGSDVYQDAPDRSHWASLPMGWAFDEGVTGGIAAGAFGFGTNVSREEMALFLCRTVAPGTCQPSQQPLPSSVVSTSTGTIPEPPTTPIEVPETTGTDYGDSHIPFTFSGRVGHIPVITERQPIVGNVPIHVFYCARQGKYTGQDLTELVRLLNNEVSPRYRAESSNLLNMTFMEGTVLSPDLEWDSVSLEEARSPCNRDARLTLRASEAESRRRDEVLLILDTPRAGFLGYGGGRTAWSWSLDMLGVHNFIDVVAHELGHSTLDLPHDFVTCGDWESLLVNTQQEYDTQRCVAGGMILGGRNENSPYLGAGFLLSCHHRRVLGWPVGGNSPPCVLQPPSIPEVSNFSLNPNGFTVSWTPPGFTDQVPITRYTLNLLDSDYQFYEEKELSSEERSFTWDGLAPGAYSIHLWANSKHGSGDAYDIPPIPFAPSPETVQVLRVTATEYRVSWSPVSGATHYIVWSSGDGPPATFEPDGRGGLEVSGFGGGIVVRDGTSQVVYDRKPDTEYTVRVLACGFEDVFGSEECSLGTEVTVPAKPPEPSNDTPGMVSAVSIAEAGDDWLVLSWDPVPGATFYECGYLTSGGNTWLVGPGTADTSCELWWDPRQDTGILRIGLVAGTTYTVGVTACQKPLVMCSEWTTATASTQLLAPAPASYPVSVKEVGDTWFTLSWDAPAADAHYNLRVVTGLSRTFRVAGRTRDVTVAWLQPNTNYTIKVRTCRGTGGTCGNWVTISVSTSRSN